VTSAIDLVATTGPLEDSRIELRPDRPLLIGRSFRGLHLPDPLVSIEHAEIAWVTDYYWISDLGSLTGTFIDDERLGREAKPLVPGSVLRIGESEFRVSPRRSWPVWFAPLLALLGLLAAVAGFLLYWASLTLAYEPVVLWHEPIHQGPGGEGGAEGSRKLVMSKDFVRETGIDHRDISIHRVTDYDANGVDEVWLRFGDEEYVFTFGPGGEWVPIGRFPNPRDKPGAACKDLAGWPFPEVRCDGVTFRYEGGKYHLVGQQGVVAWMPPTAEGARSDPPRPYRFTMINTESLAGFLAARGVTEPVHYLVCEEALPGLSAQVLTASGELIPLDYGCIRELELLRDTQSEEFGAQVPVAVAFTATGYRALVDDVTTYLAGNPDGMFLNDRQRRVVETFSASPEWRIGGVRLSFIGLEQFMDPIAKDVRLSALRQLEWSGHGPVAAPLATTLVLHPEGPDEADPEGPSKLSITTGTWNCALRRWCIPTRKFLVVEEKGGGARKQLIEMDYKGGRSRAITPTVDVVVQIDTYASKDQIDVKRVRLSYRLPPG